MNRRERLIAERYESQGYEVIRKGWPDFLFYKSGEAKFVEVKRPCLSQKRGLSQHQRRTLEILRELGLSVSVEYVS